jgi:RNA polymerase sigma-70 factor (ECF subfamily)
MTLEPEKREIFEKDLKNTQDQIRSFIARSGVQIDDVDDIAQEVYIIYYTNFNKRPEDGNVSAWLKGIARNVCLHYFRSKKSSAKNMEFIMEVLEQVEVPFEKVSFKAKAADALKKCLQKLSEKNRKIIQMFYQDGKDYKAISKQLSTTAKTIGMTLYRIKILLKECVERNIS